MERKEEEGGPHTVAYCHCWYSLSDGADKPATARSSRVKRRSGHDHPGLERWRLSLTGVEKEASGE
jgi:hypothetical protein